MIRRFISFNKKISRSIKARCPKLFVGDNSHEELGQRIWADIAALPAKSVLECGGIDRPLLRKQDVSEYIGLDIESRPACYEVYHKFIVQSVEQPIDVRVDMVISTTLMEHVPDTSAAFKAVHGALRPGGTTHHYIPCKWHPYSIALRLVGWRMQRYLINLLRPEAAGVSGYRTFFDNCSPGGLRRAMLQAGFADINIKPYYRAADYFEMLVPVYVLVGLFETMCEKFNFSFFAAGVVLSGRKPLDPRPL